MRVYNMGRISRSAGPLVKRKGWQEPHQALITCTNYGRQLHIHS
jgi:hypothetical protein